MRRDTYLEFNRRLKIKRRSDFTIDFKTTEQDGVIFYTADERDIDFIALFLKGGQVRDIIILLWFILVSLLNGESQKSCTLHIYNNTP